MTSRFAIDSDTSPQRSPSSDPRSAAAAPAHHQAMAVTAVLIARYTRCETLELELHNAVDGALGTRATLQLGPHTTWAELLDQLAPYDADFSANTFQVHWYENRDLGTSPHLKLFFLGRDLPIAGSGSSVCGLLAKGHGMEAIQQHFSAALAALHHDPQQAAASACLHSAADADRLLALAAGDPLPELLAEGLLHDIFAQQAALHPQQAALSYDGGELTYQELHTQATAVAATLQMHGIGPGQLVALHLPRSPQLYVAMLGILKSGAGYVPLDFEWPQERLQDIIADCQAAALLWGEPNAVPPMVACPCINVWQLPTTGARDMQPVDTKPDDICYVIYTSGSTGKPKGVAIEHRQVVQLVRTEQHLFHMRPTDRVFAGFSPAFDAAVEEIWLAFAAGATLVVGHKQRMLGDLAAYVTQRRVSVFSTVPTLLATLQGNLPTVRLLITGGEACSQALVERWSRPGMAMVNTYGPTETTVIATSTPLEPGRTVTIGRPIPNYKTYIVDGRCQLVPPGVAGELCIGGPGLARGYVNNPALTAQRFVHHAFAGAPATIYRTGDLARYNEEGDLEFLGRVDQQVKLRGFRIELGEIDAALQAQADVMQAVTLVREDRAKQQQLVAYVVLRASCDFSTSACKQALRERLPTYMIPSHVEVLQALPLLASGKIDQRALPAPKAADKRSIDPQCKPHGPVEEALATVWQSLLGVTEISRHDNFFLDLDGHSLLAAQMVSLLRRQPMFSKLSVLDVYQAPTVAGLAAHYAPGIAAKAAANLPSAVHPTASRWAYYICAAAQLVGLYGIFGVASAQWLGPYLMYAWLRYHQHTVMLSLLMSSGFVLATYPLLLVVGLLAKWLIVGRYKAGSTPVWGLTYWRFWMVRQILGIAPTWLLVGTPLLNFYYRLLGARIGRNVFLASDSLHCFDLLHIEDDAVVGVDASMHAYKVQAGNLLMGPIHLGPRAVVGARSLLDPDTALGADASVAELSRISFGTNVPPQEAWAGSPAQWVHQTDTKLPIVRPTAATHFGLTVAYGVLVLLFPGFVMAAFLPGLFTLYYFEQHLGGWYLLGAPVVSLLFVVTFLLEVVLVKWLFLGSFKAGRYPLYSFSWLRKWVFDRSMDMSIDVLGGLYATLFLNPWLRMLGVRVGKGVEVSTASSLTPDLLQLDDDAFLADCVSVGTPQMARGYAHLATTQVGERAFIGNSAIIPSGTAIGADCLVGCLSAAPTCPKESQRVGASWFGSPAIALPHRQSSRQFAPEKTYKPTRKLVIQRVIIESLRVTLPTTCAVILTCVLMTASIRLHARLSHGAFIALFPLMYAAMGISAWGIVVAMKWLLMGRYRAGEQPLWSTFVWRNELVTAMHENLADDLLNHLLSGTPYLAWFFRALGSKIGRRVYVGTTQFTEYDLIDIGDDVSLNLDCTLQTHLFEDRVMKMSHVKIAHGCTVGEDAVVLYDTHMEGKSELSALSLLMKGEVLPANSRWEGSPAQPAA